VRSIRSAAQVILLAILLHVPQRAALSI